MRDLGQHRQIDFGIGGIGVFHCLDQGASGVVTIRRVSGHVHLETRLVAAFVVLALGHLVQRQARQRSDGAVGFLASQLQEGRSLGHFAGDQRHGQAQALHLLGHRRGLRVGAAVEHHVRRGGLDRGQDGGEVGGFVIGEFALDHIAAGGLGGFLELVGQTLAVSGAVVDDHHFLGAQLFHHELTHHRALLSVGSHRAEGILEALRGKGRRSGHRDHRNAGV